MDSFFPPDVRGVKPAQLVPGRNGSPRSNLRRRAESIEQYMNELNQVRTLLAENEGETLLEVNLETLLQSLRQMKRAAQRLLKNQRRK